jgi:hypothetical protein
VKGGAFLGWIRLLSRVDPEPASTRNRPFGACGCVAGRGMTGRPHYITASPVVRVARAFRPVNGRLFERCRTNHGLDEEDCFDVPYKLLVHWATKSRYAAGVTSVIYRLDLDRRGIFRRRRRLARGGIRGHASA